MKTYTFFNVTFTEKELFKMVIKSIPGAIITAFCFWIITAGIILIGG